MLAAALAAPAVPAAAQERTIELPVETMTAHDVIDAVQGQTEYLFTTNQNTVLDALTVTVTKREMTVKAVLDELLKGSGLVYRLFGGYIVITAAPATASTAQNTEPPASQG